MVVVTSLGPPEEGIHFKKEATTACINEKKIGKGTLYVSEARVSWVIDGESHKFSLEYPHIAMHAISRETTSFPNAEHLYLMIDTRLVDSEPSTPLSTPETSDDDDDENDQGMTEIRFVPDDKSCLDALFKAMSDCQALHPDPEDGEEDEGEDVEAGDEGMFEDADEEDETPNGAGDGGQEERMDEN